MKPSRYLDRASTLTSWHGLHKVAYYFHIIGEQRTSHADVVHYHKRVEEAGKIQTWTEEEKTLVSIPDKEIHILENNRQFIAASLGINQVEVYEAGSGDDVGGKAGFAIPLEPGLAFI